MKPYARCNLLFTIKVCFEGLKTKNTPTRPLTRLYFNPSVPGVPIILELTDRETFHTVFNFSRSYCCLVAAERVLTDKQMTIDDLLHICHAS